MKSIRVLLAFSVFALCAGLASAHCGTCEKKGHSDEAKKQECAAKCDKAKEGCEKDCAKPCCKKECSEADKAKCDKDKKSCCPAAAEAGKDAAKK